jgi:Protein of unknown function (DUF2505)
VRFEAEHRFHGSPGAVADLLADPQFYRTLDLPDLSRPEVVESSTEGQRSKLRLRYEWVGSLDPIARRLLGGDRPAWIQEVSVNQATDSGELEFNAADDPARLHGSARFQLRADGDGCVRRLTGELVVGVPIIGSRAERKIVPGLLRRLDIEAQAIDGALRREPT